MGADNTRSAEDYRQWLRDLLSMGLPTVVFTDPATSLALESSLGRETLSQAEFRHMVPEDLEQLFKHGGAVARIQKEPSWLARAPWLRSSPQALLPLYNPLVMSKVALLGQVASGASSSSRSFFWCDAGLTRTCPNLLHSRAWAEFLERRLDRCLVASFPYPSGTEIHGFHRTGMARLCRTDHVDYVVRGGFFGGPPPAIEELVERYEVILDEAFASGDMGTEENILTALAHRHPELLARFELAGDGLVWPLFAQLNEGHIKLLTADRVSGAMPDPKADTELVATPKIDNRPSSDDTTLDVAILTFNSTQQLTSLVESWREEFACARQITVIDNSTDLAVVKSNAVFCAQQGLEHMPVDNNGICGGRQRAARLFAQSNAGYLLYLEDDMLKSQLAGLCRSGFPSKVDELLPRAMKLMTEHRLDLLKLNYSELFGTHARQWAWCNMSEQRQKELQPSMPTPTAPVEDSQLPHVKLQGVRIVDGLPAACGEVHYSNWPHLINRLGNQRLFLEPDWSMPYEQDWMVRAYELQMRGELNSAVLLASPIEHRRDHYYEASERVEHQ